MTTILIVDDHILFREGMRNIIQKWEDFEVVGEAANGMEAIEKVADVLPDIVLMDINMPGMNGIKATWQIKQKFPSVQVVMLTMSEEDEDLFLALKSGASGYILKDIPSRRFHDLLRGVMHNETPISGVMATKVVAEFNQPQDKSDTKSWLREPLTNREQEILEKLVEGKTNAEIAEEIFLSESTVKKYLRNILEKLHLKNRVEAAAYAVREGLLDN